MRVCFKTDVGKLRTINEDAFYVDAEMGIFIVADGMGGHNAGEVASSNAVQIIAKILLDSIGKVKNRDQIYQLMQSAIFYAHKKIRELSSKDPTLKGMGTTVVVALIKNGILYVANVGDSRAYLINFSEIKQITEDHSVVSYLLRTKAITEKEAKVHPYRHVITQALGATEHIAPYIVDIPLNSNTKILLCTDGLTEHLTDDEIMEIINSTENVIEKAAEKLVIEANNKGGKDNITLILVEV